MSKAMKKSAALRSAAPTSEKHSQHNKADRHRGQTTDDKEDDVKPKRKKSGTVESIDRLSNDDEGGGYDGTGVLEALKLLQAQYGDDRPAKSKSVNARKADKAYGLDDANLLKTSTGKPKILKSTDIKMRQEVVDSECVLAPSEGSDVPKLSKQQKRDLKRNAAAAAQQASLTADDEGLPPSTVASLLDTSPSTTTLKEEGSSVYKRTPKFPTPMPQIKTAKRFLVPGDEHYKKVLATCYNNFKLDPPDAFSQSFHNRFSCEYIVSAVVCFTVFKLGYCRCVGKSGSL
jgi:hypothetical protein